MSGTKLPHRLEFPLSPPSATTVPVANAAEGQIVKIVGRVRLAEPPLVSPVSLLECAYYSIRVEDHDPEDDDPHRGGPAAWWEESERHQACWVEDSSGKCLVELTQAFIKAHMPPADFAEDAEEAFLSKREATLVHALFASEVLLETDKMIGVVGTEKWEPNPETPGSKRLTIASRPKGPVMVRPQGDNFIFWSWSRS